MSSLDNQRLLFLRIFLLFTVPTAKEKPNESDVLAKENDSKKPANGKLMFVL